MRLSLVNSGLVGIDPIGAFRLLSRESFVASGFVGIADTEEMIASRCDVDQTLALVTLVGVANPVAVDQDPLPWAVESVEFTAEAT
jgi:hypothetical protein